ncbi:NifB/NifX family molybdenum-iron cluster-binding protein [Desulfobulbus elongatus]|uniref:NifB/NifX family molybdenum-iron cluster-binding protein n=1 Tax=Desulfobulbus elongatus TaxID=53332 RepID=UPI00146F944F|nr:NifB/NifX family molybdenum-iron cluster-binding protein [Desulfobulbus elongatus]
MARLLLLFSCPSFGSGENEILLRRRIAEKNWQSSDKGTFAPGKGNTMKDLHMAEELIRHDYNPARPHVAIASTDGESINQPLGKALSLLIYRAGAAEPELVERRAIPIPSKGLGRWMELGKVLSDCGWLLVPGIGEAPFKILVNKGIMVYIVEGLIVDALRLIVTGGNLHSMARPEILARPAVRQQAGIRCTSSVCGGGGRGCYES